MKVNGGFYGYFKGAKGLRQGDPLSSYLFVIAMEVLSILISKETVEPNFKFHWKTKQLRLTHLCFADDLILFCNGDIWSVNILKGCLTKFASLSGLHLNATKSMCFLANVPPDDSADRMASLGFRMGVYPAKFLGVPLLTSKLSLADCRPLLDKITSRISSWTNRFLSYTGRLQLLKFVLFSIQSYWSSFFTLLAAALKELKVIFSRFLWKGPSLSKFGAKVAWSKVSLPLSEGGMGLKQLDMWNKADILLHLWNTINPASSSIWANWVRTFSLKGKHFWCMNNPNYCSWI